LFKDFDKLSNVQLDALKEISNIGAGNAATALAQMLSTKIDMNVPRVRVLPFSEVADLMGGAEIHVVGIYLSVSGSAPSSILFILPIEKACLLVDMLLNRTAGQTLTEGLNDMGKSAMMELGNIISAAFLNAVSMFTKLTFIPSVPALATDMAGAILNGVLAQLGEIADYVLVLETEFQKNSQDIVGYLFLLPEPESLDTILSSLGVSF